MGNEANVWQPREILEISGDTKSVEEKFIATAGQNLFTLLTFSYAVATGAVEVHKNGLLLTKGTDWVEQTSTTFTIVVPCTAGDVVVATGHTAITGTVDVRDTDIFITNYQAIRDYTGTEITLYAQGKATHADGGEGNFQLVTGAAPATYVDNNASIIVPTGGDGSSAWINNLAVTNSAVLVGGVTAENLGVNYAARFTLYPNTQWNNKRKDIICCVPRVVAGTIELLDDATHEPLGFASAAQNGDYEMQINYSSTYGQVNSVIVGIDNELAPYGVFCGGSVGLTNTKFIAYAALEGTLLTTSFGSTTLFKSPTDVQVSTANDVITVTHTADAVNGASYSVTPNFSSPNICVDVVNNYSFTVKTVVDLAGYVRYSGGAFDFDATVPNFISASQTGISFAEASGVLTVTHPAATNYDVQVTGHGGVYIPQVTAIGNTSFSVTFYDYTGVAVTTADTNMKVWIKRKVPLLGKMPSSASFEVKGPILAVRSAVLSDVGGSNFWALGINQDA